MIETNASEVSITLDMGEFNRLVAAGDRVYSLAAASSLNKAMAKARTQIKREIAVKARVPSQVVQKRLHMRRATQTVLEARLTMWPHPLSALTLGGHETATGVEVGGGQHVFDSAFIARDKRGELRAFRRAPASGLAKSFDTGRPAPGVMAPRKPMRAMRVPFPGSFEVIKTQNRKAYEHLREILPRELNWRLKRAAT